MTWHGRRRDKLVEDILASHTVSLQAILERIEGIEAWIHEVDRRVEEEYYDAMERE